MMNWRMSMILSFVSMTRLSSFLEFEDFPEFPLASLDCWDMPGFIAVVSIDNIAPISLRDLKAPPAANEREIMHNI